MQSPCFRLARAHFCLTSRFLKLFLRGDPEPSHDGLRVRRWSETAADDVGSRSSSGRRCTSTGMLRFPSYTPSGLDSYAIMMPPGAPPSSSDSTVRASHHSRPFALLSNHAFLPRSATDHYRLDELESTEPLCSRRSTVLLRGAQMAAQIHAMTSRMSWSDATFVFVLFVTPGHIPTLLIRAQYASPCF